MKYIVTYDDSEGEIWPIVLWHPDAEEHLEYESGLWSSRVPAYLLDEMNVEEFEKKHGKLELEPGQKRAMNVVVHWITEEE